MLEKKYYLIVKKFIGEKSKIYNNGVPAEVVRIQLEPGRKISNKEVCESGCLGYWGDYRYTAHGVFETLQAARDAAVNRGYTEQYTEELVRPEALLDQWPADDWFDDEYENVAERYELTADTEEDEIAELAYKLQKEAKNKGQFVVDLNDYLLEVVSNLQILKGV